MKKAQAFDVFQLMIAAVIALAILGILLSIISQIFIPTQRPIQVIGDKLTDAYQHSPAVFQSAAKATFQKGESIPASIFAKNTGGIPPTFKCADALTGVSTGGAGVLDCTTEGTLIVDKTFDAIITTCCPSATECYVGIGMKPTGCS